MTDTSLMFDVMARDKASATFSKIKVAAVAAFTAVGAAAFTLGRSAVNAARDLQETQTKIDTLFGASAASVNAFAATAETALGQSRQSALDAAATFAIYGKQAGLTGDKLVGFSTNLTKLASDMASFSNTSPEEAIQAIGSAMRGESDPIEKYGVLLNETTIKARALKMGLIKTTSEALSPQLRVLAATAELYAQTGTQQGDFARNSAGLANQQRILTAQVSNFKAELGQALLPVMEKVVTMLTSKAMPALQQLWAQHGPKVIAFADKGADKFGAFIDKLSRYDWPSLIDRGGAAIRNLGPTLQNVSNSAPAFADTLNLAGIILKWIADNADLAAKALPYLAAGFLLVKTAQVGANVAATVSVPLRAAELVTTWKQNAALKAHTAALTANTAASRAQTVSTVAGTAATTAGDVAQKRSLISMAAMKTAQIAGAAATGIATAAQWLLNASWYGFPVVWIIAAIIALIAIIVLVIKYHKEIWAFAVQAWQWIWDKIKAFGSWLGNEFVPALVDWLLLPWRKAWEFATWLFEMWKAGVGFVVSYVVDRFNWWVNFLGSLPGRVSNIAGNMWNSIISGFKGMINYLISGWNRLDFSINLRIPDWVPGIGGRGFYVADIIPDLPYLDVGGDILRTGIAMVHEGERVVPAAQVRSLDKGSPRTAVLRPDGSAIADWIISLIRKAVDDRGGDVQIVLGGRS